MQKIENNIIKEDWNNKYNFFLSSHFNLKWHKLECCPNSEFTALPPNPLPPLPLLSFSARCSSSSPGGTAPSSSLPPFSLSHTSSARTSSSSPHPSPHPRPAASRGTCGPTCSWTPANLLCLDSSPCCSSCRSAASFSSWRGTWSSGSGTWRACPPRTRGTTRTRSTVGASPSSANLLALPQTWSGKWFSFE